MSFINNVYPHASAASPLQIVYKTILAVNVTLPIFHVQITTTSGWKRWRNMDIYLERNV